MAFWNWSKTAATNATADPTIVWSEGQAPSSVNDSARAMMARLAEWRDDISGANVTSGTSTHYTLTSNQGFDSLAHMGNQTLALIMHATCGDNPTLNVDGLGDKPIQSSGGTGITAGTLIAATVYRVTYFPASTNFVLNDFYGNPYSIPIGGLMPYLGASAPNSNFVLPLGQSISRSTYATLFSLVSTTFGVGNGTTTFNVPDLRGRAIHGLDAVNPDTGLLANRITTGGLNFDGTVLGTAGGAQNHTLLLAEAPTGQITLNFSDPTHAHAMGTEVGNARGPGPGNMVDTLASSMNTSAASTNISASLTDHAGGGAHTILNPCMILPYILRVI